MDSPIKLIVGLGNPGTEYQLTRHNAGVWFIEELTKANNLVLRSETKLHGAMATFSHESTERRLFVPSTYMNLSGQAVKAISQYYKISPPEILIVHDDLDIPSGTTRLKWDGGHGGHNGLRDIISHLNTKDFYRLRIGIGRPSNSHDVVNFVLNRPSKTEAMQIHRSIEDAAKIVPLLLSGKIQQAMHLLHTQS